MSSNGPLCVLEENFLSVRSSQTSLSSNFLYYYDSLSSRNAVVGIPRNYFLSFFFGHSAWGGGGEGVLIPQPGMKLTPPAGEVESPDYWSIREVSPCNFKCLHLSLCRVDGGQSKMVYTLFTQRPGTVLSHISYDFHHLLWWVLRE